MQSFSWAQERQLVADPAAAGLRDLVKELRPPKLDIMLGRCGGRLEVPGGVFADGGGEHKSHNSMSMS